MAKRKLNPVLRAWQECRAQAGATPFKKMSPAQRREVEACVLRKTGRK